MQWDAANHETLISLPARRQKSWWSHPARARPAALRARRIFDKDREAKYPVDRGVFDVSSTAEVIVPIAAKLRVEQATLFAVTVEKPGGVVVSKRKRIVVAAPTG